jgi:hypothetical protein
MGFLKHCKAKDNEILITGQVASVSLNERTNNFIYF